MPNKNVFPTDQLQFYIDPNSSNCVGDYVSGTSNSSRYLLDAKNGNIVGQINADSQSNLQGFGLTNVLAADEAGIKYFSFGVQDTGGDFYFWHVNASTSIPEIQINSDAQGLAFKAKPNSSEDYTGTVMIWLYVTDQNTGWVNSPPQEIFIMGTDMSSTNSDLLRFQPPTSAMMDNGNNSTSHWRPHHNGFTDGNGNVTYSPLADQNTYLGGYPVAELYPNPPNSYGKTQKGVRTGWYCVIVQQGVSAAGKTNYGTFSNTNVSGNEDKKYVFINGEPTYSSQNTSITNAEQSFAYIGNRASLSDEHTFRGRIGPIAVWDKVLTYDEIIGAYNQHKNFYQP